MTGKAREEMIAHCRRDYPNEACGYLAGKNGISTAAVALANTHESPASYEMDPKEQLLVQKKLRQEGLVPLAIYHSHVATEAVPSRRDIDQATAIQDFFDGFYVLVSLKYDPPKVRAFQIRDGAVTEAEAEEVAG